MFCSNCGSQLTENARFCSGCGTPIVGTSDQHPIFDPINGNIPNNNSLVKPDASDTKQKQLNVPGIISGVVLALGSFLPYVSASVFGLRVERTLLEGGDGYLFLALAIFAIVGGLNRLAKSSQGLVFIGALSAIACIYDALNIFHWSENASLYSREIGYYCILFGSFGVLASGIYGLVKKIA